jgi:lysophospholipase L1-like esterase
MKLLIALLVALSIAATAKAADPSFADFDRRARAGDALNVVFFGASLTWGANATDSQLTSFRGEIARKLEAEYPQVRFKFWDGAIGGTGSQLGVFRLERDVLRRHPDLVFLDFSANDDINSGDTETLASYEAIIRRLVDGAHVPVVQVIFPFKWDVQIGKLDAMKRRDAHLAISAAYRTPVGDAIALAQQRVAAGKTNVDELWPDDGVHPGDRGYQLFADAAWDALRQAIKSETVCKAPERMLYADTYLSSVRFRLSQLDSLPAGWKVSRPHVVAAYFDMLMSRWLDDEVVATAPKAAPTGGETKPAEPLTVRFVGTMVMLFGESTMNSVHYKATIDGELVTHKSPDGKQLLDDFDAGYLGKRMKGNSHLVQVIAVGLKPGVEHTLQIEPKYTGGVDEEVRLESVCVAGPGAEVHSQSPKTQPQ